MDRSPKRYRANPLPLAWPHRFHPDPLPRTAHPTFEPARKLQQLAVVADELRENLWADHSHMAAAMAPKPDVIAFDRGVARRLAQPIADWKLIFQQSLEESRAQSPAICPSDDTSPVVAPHYRDRYPQVLPARGAYGSANLNCRRSDRPRRRT